MTCVLQTYHISRAGIKQSMYRDVCVCVYVCVYASVRPSHCRVLPVSAMDAAKVAKDEWQFLPLLHRMFAANIPYVPSHAGVQTVLHAVFMSVGFSCKHKALFLCVIFLYFMEDVDKSFVTQIIYACFPEPQYQALSSI